MIFYRYHHFNAFSAKTIFNRKKKVFRRFYSYLSFMLERLILNSFFLANWGRIYDDEPSPILLD